MPRHLPTVFFSRPALLAAMLFISRPVSAQTVWSGLTKSFSKAAGSDYTLPQNQDPLTANVVLTRGSSGGLINIAAESFYNSSSSPALTEWATDLNNPSETIAATNYSSLSFTDWLDAYGGINTNGFFIPDRNAVVHLVPDNIYLDLRFTSWSPGHNNVYSYIRAEPPAALAGDYNQDALVDAADYVAWRKGASPNPNTIGDYNTWRANFGSGAGTGAGDNGLSAGSAVPEPTFGYALLGSAVLAFRRAKTRRISV